MNTSLRLAVGFFGIVFVVLGAGWLVAPATISPRFGMDLQEALGLSTQIGDLSSFFLTLGVCMLLALFTGSRFWLVPSIMLLAIAALGRTIAWLFHDAALAVPMIAVEVIVAVLLLVAARVCFPSDGRP